MAEAALAVSVGVASGRITLCVAELAVTLERLEETLAGGGSAAYHFWVAVQDGRAAGFACSGKVPSAEGAYQLFGLAVAPRLAVDPVGVAERPAA